MKFLLLLFVISIFIIICQAHVLRIPLRKLPHSANRLRYLQRFRNGFMKQDNSDVRVHLQNMMVDAEPSEHFGLIHVGTPPQPINVLFDTGSLITWVPSAKSTEEKVLRRKHKYNNQKSTTYRPTDLPNYNSSYGDHSGIYGIFSNDTFQIGDRIKIENQTFVEVLSYHTSFSDQFDGIMGLRYRTSSDYNVLTPFENIFQQHKLTPIFSYYLNRFRSGPDSGEIILGGIDTSKYKGQVTWAKVTEKVFYKIAVQSIMIDKVKIYGSESPAIVDTGTRRLLGPPKIVKKINERIQANKYNFEVNCNATDTFPSITFNIDNKEYTLTPKDYIEVEKYLKYPPSCYSSFKPAYEDFADKWILGETFLYKYYSVYDLNENKVGFAEAV